VQQGVASHAAISAPPLRRRSRTQTTMEWVALVAFALVGAGWIYFWQNSGAFGG